MPYGQLFSRSFHLVRRYPVLWLLGSLVVFFGSGGGNWYSTVNMLVETGSVPSLNWERLSPFLLVPLVVGIVGIVLVFVVLSYVFRVALVDATAKAHREESFSFSEAFRRGFSFSAVRLFLVYLLAGIPYGLFVLFVVGVLLLEIGLVIWVFRLEQPLLGLVVLLAGIALGLFLFGLLMVGGAVFSVFVQWGARFVVVARRGVLESLEAAWFTFRCYWQESVLLWLIQAGVLFVVQFLLGILLMVVWIPLFFFLFTSVVADLSWLFTVLVVVGGVGLIWVLTAFVQGGALAVVETLWTGAWLTLYPEEGRLQFVTE